MCSAVSLGRLDPRTRCCSIRSPAVVELSACMSLLDCVMRGVPQTCFRVATAAAQAAASMTPAESGGGKLAGAHPCAALVRAELDATLGALLAFRTRDPLLLTRQVQCLMACVPYFVPPGAGGGDRFLPQARLSWK